MFAFNLQNFLNDVFTSATDGGAPKRVAVNCSVRITAEQNDDFTAAVTCFLQNLRSYLNIPASTNCFWQDPVSPDIIVMHEHGFMDSPGYPGTIGSMIFALADISDPTSYLYVTQYASAAVNG